METNNETITKKLDELKTATDEGIKRNKKFEFKIGDAFSKKLGDEKDTYYEKYLRKTSGVNIPSIDFKKPVEDEKEQSTIENKTKAKGKKRDDKITYEVMPQHHFNTLLAMAFSKGEKLYSSMREKAKEEAGKYEPKENIKEKIARGENEDRGLSAVEYLMMSSHLYNGKNSNIKLAVKKGELKILEEFAANEELIYKALKELRNFYSHIFHEPGPVSFKNLYGDEYKPQQKLTEDEWAKARDWFTKIFTDAKEHKLKTLAKVLERDGTQEEKQDAEKVIKKIESYLFEFNGNISREALLFIACMFLRKSDAAYFTKKWTGMKKAEGVYKSTQSFFTDNALKESKSVLTHNADLYKYRQIIGILSTMPEIKTESMKPFYDFIKENNNNYSKRAEKARSKADIEKERSFIISHRKSSNYTYWYMKYLNDNNLLNEFRVAYYKTEAERLKYLEENDIPNSEELKLRMKRATGEEKKRLTEIYKESKKNFIFKQPELENDNFCVKKLNVFFQYDFDYSGKQVTVQLTVSPDFLMKWVFIHLMGDKNIDIKKILKEFLEEYYKRCINSEFTEPVSGLKAIVVFPGSLTKTVEREEEKIGKEKIIKRIEKKYYELNKFNEENKSKKAPWKFGSKRKIDIIMEYVHLIYLDMAYDEKKSTDTMRHEALNDMEYLEAFEKLRYFGRYKGTSEFKKIFFEDKKTYFHPIIEKMKEVDSLENLFNFAIRQNLIYMQNAKEKINDDNSEKYCKVFKITGKSISSKIKHHAEMFAVNHSVPHEIIELDKIRGYAKWKHETKNKQWISDFSFIRSMLEQKGGFSNTDYLMKEIMPILLKKKKLPEKENGKLKGNQQMYNALARSKTNELMLWEIGKYYWKQATGNDFSRSFDKMKLNSDKEMTKAFRKTNPYYKIFQEELEIKLQRKERNKQKEKKNPIYTIKIKPKKFDDEYQYYEQEHIIDYIENYKPKVSEDGQLHFEELNKKIKDELARYLDDIYLLMMTEKKIIQDDFDSYAGLLKEKNSQLPEYHIAFDGKNIDDKEKSLNKVIYKLLEHNGAFDEDDLNDYRINVMHQQLQPEKEKYRKIRLSLTEYCVKNGLLKIG